MDFVLTEKDEEQNAEEQTAEEQTAEGHSVVNETNEVINKSNIPKRIFQTHKSIQYIQSKPNLKSAINSWRRFVPEFGYHFYTDEMCDEFMKTDMVEEFGEEIYEAYSRLPIPVMKADLWRYCIIYKYGGIYADADAVCLCDPKMFTLYETQLVCAPENSVHLCQWTFAAPPNSPFLKSIIELAVKRILTITEIRGEHVIHYLTGPGVFTDGIEKHLHENEMSIFNDKKQYYRYKNPTMICFMYERFHKTMIHHLFMGQDNDGWTHERNRQLV
jgi:mannosyltransferase OCH1-like enzyme